MQAAVPTAGAARSAVRVIQNPSELRLLAHFAGPRPEGGWQVIDAWECEEAFRRFLGQKIFPVAQELGAPPFDSKVFEIHNSLIP